MKRYLGIKKAGEGKASKIRQRISQHFAELGKLKGVLATRKPMVKGTVYEYRNRCGKKGCRCMRGELHTRMALSYSEQGRTRLRYLKPEQVRRYEWLTANYRRFRIARARLVRLTRGILSLVDELMEVMRDEERTD